ncbi:MAG: carboxypeptidase-like regulatory domain-containing protein [Kofleriaceae bacterium]
MKRLVFAFLVACGSSHDAPPADSGTSPDAPGQVDAPNGTTFSYTPGWTGVTAVEVDGEIDGGTWGTLATLTENGGTWTTTAQLAPGHYTYLLHVTGDADAGAHATDLERDVMDPFVSSVTTCSTDSPAYMENPMNPCASLTIPDTTTLTVHHVSGKAVVGADPAVGFLVLIERQESGGHHFFVNRITTGADGTYAFDVAEGQYRIQVQHPQYESKTDMDLDPKMLKLQRRDISTAFAVSADVAVSDADMAETSYGMFKPLNTATLPTTFSFPTVSARLEVYGPGMRIGDPWFTSAKTTAGTMDFDGTFNTDKKKTDTVTPGTQYWWGIEASTPPVGSGGVTWTYQSMVFPMTWTASQ